MISYFHYTDWNLNIFKTFTPHKSPGTNICRHLGKIDPFKCIAPSE